MASENDLRLEEMGTGEQIGSWGTTTNTNLSLIAEAFSYQTEAKTLLIIYACPFFLKAHLPDSKL